jgi:hypothetical protein
MKFWVFILAADPETQLNGFRLPTYPRSKQKGRSPVCKNAPSSLAGDRLLLHVSLKWKLSKHYHMSNLYIYLLLRDMPAIW